MAAKKKSDIQELSEFIRDHMATKEDIRELKGDIARLDAKIDHVNERLGAFENSEIDKRLQLEVRVTALEKHLGIDRKVAF